MFQKFYHFLAFPACLHPGAHSIRKTHYKTACLFLSANIIVSGNLLHFLGQLCHSVKYLIAYILHKMNRMVFSIYNSSSPSCCRHGSSELLGQKLCHLINRNALPASGTHGKKNLTSSFHLIHHPDLLHHNVALPENLLQFRHKLGIRNGNVVQVFCHHIHDSGHLLELLCHGKAAFDHPVVPYQLLPLPHIRVTKCLIILGKTTAYTHPVAFCLLYFLLISLLHGTNHPLASSVHFLRLGAPADFPLITVAAYLITGLPYDSIHLAVA